jgi:hypothetical protein
LEKEKAPMAGADGAILALRCRQLREERLSAKTPIAPQTFDLVSLVIVISAHRVLGGKES